MATTAFDSSDAEAPARPPLSTHPAFPAIVALWFAVLLGFGSLVLPAVLFESAFAAVGLDSLVPLGFATRVAIALVAAVAGALAGLAIASRIAGPRRVREVPRPLNVREELDDEGGAPVMRRRARTLLAAEPGHDTFASPPPADQDIADLALPGDDTASAPVAGKETPIAEDDMLESALPHVADEVPPEVPGLPAGLAPESFGSERAGVAPDQLGLVQLVERLGSSLERRRERLAAAIAETPAPRAPFDAASAEQATQAMADYFGRPFAPPTELDEHEADDPLAAFSLPLDRPIALEPFVPEEAGLDDEDEADDGSFGSLLAMRSPFAPQDADPAAEEVSEEPAARPFDPPAAAALPEARPDAWMADTDAQLREALAALQRTRGAV